MDNTQTSTPQPVAQQAPVVAPQQPASEVTSSSTVPNAMTPPKSKKMLWIVLAAVIVLALGGTAAYLLLSMSPSVQNATSVVPTVMPSPTDIPPTPTPSVTEEEAIDQMIIEDPASDLSDVTTDLQEL